MRFESPADGNMVSPDPHLIREANAGANIRRKESQAVRSCNNRVVFAFVLLAFSLALTGTSEAAQGQTENPVFHRIAVSAGAGMLSFSEVNYESGFYTGIGVYYSFSPAIGMELSGTWSSANLKGDPQKLSQGKLSPLSPTLSVQARYTSLSKTIIPYLEVGGGYSTNTFKLDAALVQSWASLGYDLKEEIKGSIGFHAGIGVDIALGPKLTASAGLRYRLQQASGSWSLVHQASGTSSSGDISDINFNALLLGIKVRYAL
jgi:outer membrane protein W